MENTFGRSQDQMLVMRLGFTIRYILNFFLIFYLVKYIVQYILHLKADTEDLDKKASSPVLKVANFFNARSLGIPYYQIITSITMLSFFISNYYIIYRYEKEGLTFSPSGSFFGFIVYLTLAIIIFEILFLLKFNGSIKLNKFVEFTDKFYLAVSYMAYISFTLSDNEVFMLIGVCLEFPVFFMQIMQISGLSKFKQMEETLDKESDELRSVSLTSTLIDTKNSDFDGSLVSNFGLFIQVFFSLIVQIFAIFSFYYVVEDYNFYYQDRDKVAFLNNYSIFYFVVIIGIGASLYFSTFTYDNMKLRRSFKIVVYYSFISVASLFVYDDLYFAVDDFMLGNNILFFGSFLFIQLPAAIITGLEIRIARSFSLKF
ncbi:MAG: hypothetical protein ACC656_02835 [Candidatus Heimdallarchaeota archaeon]